ncbi:hypothetical protein SAMN05192583_2048 [Sphingomonas gellani]|uniref:CDP-Glycerol:Poly(Glycerophosphate) glycerophosphotransferase n=1 Tax=Sphingomonas gellani TaxID=1166340 RepID=A0A1H8DT67_9SPHN|nr:hypothetical protein [Sphingomonas gellani]SEN10449.1 hypothetical protein SAMN05192583_2048 [Sphingomonas gellani]
MRIAFVYIAEAYQCYHGAAIAIALAERFGWQVVNYYNDPETPHHLERVRRACRAPVAECRRLRRSPLTAGLQRLKRLGMFKDMVLRDNRAELNEFDAIFAVENSAASLRRLGVAHPRLIFSPHGAGDRARGYIPRIATFDLVLLSGLKQAERMLDAGLIRPGHYALTGMVKLETAGRLAASTPLPFGPGPVVLYNAHKEPKLTSWPRFVEALLDGFASAPDMNLLVAPHVKMFRRRSQAVRDRWRARSTANVLVDPGSDRSVDMSYTAAADIYVGDVSAQVYEFLVEPRPCVFLNAHGIDWRDDPSFAHWHLGDVVDDPAQVMAAIRAAPARHHLYRARQEALAAASLGDRSPGAADRAAEAVVAFMAREKDAGQGRTA